MRTAPGVAVVTGAGAGAGRAIAERLGREGWKVGLISRDAERLQACARAIAAGGGEGLPCPADVADGEAVAAARDAVVARFGAIDLWVNAAMATVVAPAWRMTSAEYRRVGEVTWLGCVNGTLAALATMREAGGGSIIQIGSALAYRAIPLQSAYCAAKFAIRGFTDAVRAELIHEGSPIRIAMLQMPAMNTPQFDWARNKLAQEYRPVGEVFDPEVAADAVLRAWRDGPRELWVGGSSVQAILGQIAAPGLLDRLMARRAWAGQMTHVPEPARPDNLDAPVPGPQAARGRFGAEAKGRALIVDPHRLRLAAGAGALLGAAALTFGAARLSRARRGRPGA